MLNERITPQNVIEFNREIRVLSDFNFPHLKIDRLDPNSSLISTLKVIVQMRNEIEVDFIPSCAFLSDPHYGFQSHLEIVHKKANPQAQQIVIAFHGNGQISLHTSM